MSRTAKSPTRRIPIPPRLAAAYRRFHWGAGPVEYKEVKDPIYPELVECGRLWEVHVRPFGTGGRSGKEEEWEIRDEEKAESHLAYDPIHPCERLHIVLPETVKRELKQKVFNPANALDLNVLATRAPGRHSRMNDYPHVKATPIGPATAVVYFTLKEGDGPSAYIHKLGEESHQPPLLAVDGQGRLWLLGGNYTCPEPGITD